MPSDFFASTPMPDILDEAEFSAHHAYFCLTSGPRELLATGLGQAITVPAAGSDAPDSPLQTALKEGLQRARRAGQDNPIIVGAIPFLTTEPSCLYIPEHYEWREKRAIPPPSTTFPELVSRTLTPERPAFTASLARAVAALGQEGMSKVVLSAMQELQFSQELDATAVFRNLRQQNLNGYQFIMPLADGGDWMGASPELLLSKDGERILSNPLAGSTRRMEDPQADRFNAEQLALSSKDQREHALVVRKIAARLAPLCTELYVPERPSLIKTQTLWHLSTRIEGRLHDPSMSALQLACLLHPTPAVCGFPTEPARRLIAEIEPFERRFFSGMVGWCDADGNGEWAVAIRCGEIRGQLARLFAGAGIVDRSTAASEWAEINTKFGTMLRALGVAG